MRSISHLSVYGFIAAVACYHHPHIFVLLTPHLELIDNIERRGYVVKSFTVRSHSLVCECDANDVFPEIFNNTYVPTPRNGVSYRIVSCVCRRVGIELILNYLKATRDNIRCIQIYDSRTAKSLLSGLFIIVI